MEDEEKKEPKKIKINIGFIVFLIIFIPMFIILMTIIIKGVMYPDKIPDVFGYKPFIVLTDTKTEIKKDDLILSKIIDENQIKAGDIISYKSNNIVESHQVIDVQKEGDKTFFVIDIARNNSEEYNVKVNSEIVEGKYLFRIAKLRWNNALISRLFSIDNSNIVNSCSKI